MPDLPLDFSASYSLAYQAAVVARLRSSAKIPAAIAVLGKVEGSLETAIDEALAGVGTTIFVSPPLPAKVSSDISAVVFDEAGFVVRVIQDGATDDSGATAHLIMEIVMARVHHFTPQGIPGAGIIILDDNPIDAGASTKKRTIIDVAFTGSGNFGLDASLAEGVDE